MESFSDRVLVQADWLAEGNELTLLVHQITWESDGVLSVRLRGLNGQQLPAWQPGAHIDVHLSGSLVRQYSLCSDPGDLSHYRIGVRREEISSGGSSFVHERLRPGQTVRVVGPRNKFTVRSAERYAFVAGGIGITPILAMVRQCEERQSDWELFYAGRTHKSMAFLSELERYGDKVHLFAADTGSRINLVELVAALPDETEVYACGPENLLNELEVVCGAPHVLHLERFKAKARPVTEGGDSPIEVSCAKSGITVEVAPDVSILEALEEAGLNVASSCREGICGTCELRVLEGVPDHRDFILSPAEQKSNEVMMVCVSRAVSPNLVLDV